MVAISSLFHNLFLFFKYNADNDLKDKIITSACVHKKKKNNILT